MLKEKKFVYKTCQFFKFRFFFLLSVLSSSIIWVLNSALLLLLLQLFFNAVPIKAHIYLTGINKKYNKRQKAVICVVISFCSTEQNGITQKSYIICGVYHKNSMHHHCYIIGNALVLSCCNYQLLHNPQFV